MTNYRYFPHWILFNWEKKSLYLVCAALYNNWKFKKCAAPLPHYPLFQGRERLVCEVTCIPGFVLIVSRIILIGKGESLVSIRGFVIFSREHIYETFKQILSRTLILRKKVQKICIHQKILRKILFFLKNKLKNFGIQKS
jgi:hypothetical protein